MGARGPPLFSQLARSLKRRAPTTSALSFGGRNRPSGRSAALPACRSAAGLVAGPSCHNPGSRTIFGDVNVGGTGLEHCVRGGCRAERPMQSRVRSERDRRLDGADLNVSASEEVRQRSLGCCSVRRRARIERRERWHEAAHVVSDIGLRGIRCGLLGGARSGHTGEKARGYGRETYPSSPIHLYIVPAEPAAAGLSWWRMRSVSPCRIWRRAVLPGAAWLSGVMRIEGE